MFLFVFLVDLLFELCHRILEALLLLLLLLLLFKQ